MEQIINWFVEFFKRFGTTQPQFFKILSIVGVVATFLGFIPDFLSLLDFTLPSTWEPWVERILKIAGITTIIVSRLTTQSKVVETDGLILKATNEKALPFTATAERAAAQNN